MRRTARFPKLSDFPEQVQEVNASSPPAAFRDLGRFRLVQTAEVISNLRAALTPESREDANDWLVQVEHLLVDAYLMFELAAQAAQDDEELLKALQRPVGICVPATEHCRALPLYGWRLQHLDEVAAGMEAAELSLAKGAAASPWAALVQGRSRLRGERLRAAFELGFLIRMYQRVMEAGDRG
ncbi:hypothetical protein D9M68_620700 [compost metagenome]